MGGEKQAMRIVGGVTQAGIDGMRKKRHGRDHTPQVASCSERVSIAPPSVPKIIAKPSTSRMFETTEPVSEPRTTDGSPSATAKSAMINSGALPKLAFRKPPIPGAGVLGGVPRRLADQPRQRNQGERRQHELRRRVSVEQIAGRERDGNEGERGPEELPRHGSTLTAPC